MTIKILTRLGCLALLALASPLAFTSTSVMAEEPAVSDGTGAEGDPIVVDETGGTENPGPETDPITDAGGDEDPVYDPEIAQSGAGRPGDPAPNERGHVTKSSGVAERYSQSDRGEVQYRIIMRGNKMIKIPLQ